MITPEGLRQTRRGLGGQLADLRKAAGFTQHQLADAIYASRSSIAGIETGRQNADRDFWIRADHLTHADGALLAVYDHLRDLQKAALKTASRMATAGGLGAIEPLHQSRPGHVDGPCPAAPFMGTLVFGGELPLIEVTDHGLDQIHALTTPSGRFFNGSAIAAGFVRGVDDGRVLAEAGLDVADTALNRTGSSLLIAATDGPDGLRLYGLDGRSARRRLLAADPRTRLVMAREYLLDEITLGVLWAVTNLDDALLHDDAALADCLSDVAPYAGQTRSAASKDAVADLQAVSTMWLGSQFCAGHILRHIDGLGQPPLFWTREQHGEEASGWLLFGHKYDYLRALSDRFPSGMARSFCIPADTVEKSSLAERTLLVLALALIESFGIRIQVTAEPEYAAMDGFVLAPDEQAVLANWLGAAGVWHVDVTASRPVLREYADAVDYARARTVAVGDDSASRLRAAADFAQVPWSWLVRRCEELSRVGLAGLARPRSRLLSLAGVDRACGYLASVATVHS